MSPDRLTLDIDEVAALLGCSAAHIRRLVARGQFPAPVPLGARRVWSREAVLAFVNPGPALQAVAPLPIRTAAGTRAGPPPGPAALLTPGQPETPGQVYTHAARPAPEPPAVWAGAAAPPDPQTDQPRSD